MQAGTLTSFHVSRTRGRRAWDAVFDAWHGWRAEAAHRRREREELEWLLTVDHRTRQDLGWVSNYEPDAPELGTRDARLRALHFLHRI